MKIKEKHKGIALTIGCVLCLALNLAQAQVDLPAAINFDSDTAGNPPITGGQNQPSQLTTQAGSTILVQDSANGINTKPVVLSVGDANQYTSVITLFQPISTGIVRIEATVSFDRLVQSIFLRTAVSSSGAVITQFTSNGLGQIRVRGEGGSGILAGFYSADQPFRVRIDIDMSDKNWSLIFDDEMNGFDDDVPILGLEFVNSPSAIPYISAVSASFVVLTGTPGPASIAYDDIWICRGECRFAQTVALDIKPGKAQNVINLKSGGFIPVAILTEGEFDALQVDPDTTKFGPNETNSVRYKAKDVDKDGDADLLMYFRIQQADIACSDTRATLTGELYNGTPITGTDSVQTKNCQ